MPWQDPIYIGLVVILLSFFFFGYLLVRRTVMGLREGFEEGKK